LFDLSGVEFLVCKVLCEIKLVAGQWRKGSKWPVELVIVDNSLLPEVPVQSAPEAMV